MTSDNRQIIPIEHLWVAYFYRSIGLLTYRLQLCITSLKKQLHEYNYSMYFIMISIGMK